jgi:ribosomal protein S18 acetylase RimI-like enzyme
MDSTNRFSSMAFTKRSLHPGTAGPVPILLRRLTDPDTDSLHDYLLGLSEETRRRFGPHPFDRETLADLYSHPAKYEGFVAIEPEAGKIVAYAVIKRGYLEHDRARLENLGFYPDSFSDATFAPSVADQWQNRGIGRQLFDFMIRGLQAEGVRRIILWGGVQCDNHLAVNYYRHLGFTILGQFEYYGQNYDMMKDISSQ